MPFKKKTTYNRKKKTTYRPKRRWGVPRLPIVKADYSCMLRKEGVITIANTTSGPVLGAIRFSLADCLNHTNFTNMFDQYRINTVVVKFIPHMTEMVNKPYDDTTTPTSGGTIPNLCVAVDRDDATVPASYNELKARSKSRIVPATKPLTFKLRPSRLIATYDAGAANAYTVDVSKRWINSSSPNLNHFGLKYALEDSSPANAYIYEVEIMYYLSFKDRKE
uniref:hypothetical protein n=1 Tax=Orrella sp. TaxID=1921583 RepID=UPI004047F021